MGEEIKFESNDTYHIIGKVMDSLKSFNSEFVDNRVKAIILTNLEQAQLWALKLIKAAA